MKKFLFAAIAASLIASPVVAEAAPQHREAPQQQAPSWQDHRAPAPEYRSWRKGERFDARYARDYRQIDYRQVRGLRAPPRGYHYVRSGNDVVLVSVVGGIIGAVFANMLR